MTKETKKSEKIVKYKAANPKKFAASFNSIAPYYEELCKGEAVEMDMDNIHVKGWLVNKTIIKE